MTKNETQQRTEEMERKEDAASGWMLRGDGGCSTSDPV